MKKMMFSLALLGIVGSAQAQLISLKRCETWKDSLSNKQANGRNAWAARCAIDNYEKKMLSRNRTMVLPDSSTRIAYPIYGLYVENAEPTNPSDWFAPTVEKAPCDRPNNYEIVGFCAASCYTLDQLIMTDEGYLEVVDATKKHSQVEVLSDYSEKGLVYKLADVKHYIDSIVDGEHDIIVFETETGKKLSVTEEHPFVKANGDFVAAVDIKQGMKLLNAHGDREEVVSVFKTNYFGKVYNLQVETENLNNKIINAGGLMSGDVTVQNSKLTKLNQMLYRLKFIPKELVK